jgi:hypothetical protein
MPEILERDATFSPDRVYRYDLYRRIRLTKASRGAVAFVLLNPSTADAKREDPTVRRCLGYAASWGYEHVRVLNIFALRSTDPDALYHCTDPIGPDNDAALTRQCALTAAERVIFAWGAHGVWRGRGDDVTRKIAIVRASAQCFEFGATKDGQPMHPLYLPADRRLVSARIRLGTGNAVLRRLLNPGDARALEVP